MTAPSLGLPSLSVAERRNRQEFTQEVETYANAVTSQWPAVVAVHHVAHERSQLVAVLVNDSAENFEDVVLEVKLPVELNCVYTRPREAAARLHPPERPQPFGQWLLSHIATPPVIPVTRAPEPELEQTDKDLTLVRFPPLHVRPHTRHRLQRVLLALPPTLAGTTLTVGWRITARNTPGQLGGEVELPLPAAEQASQEVPEREN